MSTHRAALEPPDSHFVLAAQGWLELGLPAEAQADLARVAASQHQHPAVLDVRWEICARAKRWDEALSVAETMVVVEPEDPGCWVRRSYALHELRRTQEAWDGLITVLDRFPTVSVIPYNLACYACQMGRREEAWARFRQAMQVGDPAEIKALALRDPDLAPLRPEIEAMDN